MLKQPHEKGIVLIIVLIILIMMAIVSSTIFSQSMSQNKTARAHVDDLVAQQWAKGLFWRAYSASDPSTGGSFICPGGTPPPCTVTANLNGKNFNATIDLNSTAVQTQVRY